MGEQNQRSHKKDVSDLDYELRRHTNQQPPQRGGAVPGPVWVGSKWLLAFPRVPVTPGTPLYFSLCCPLNDRRRAAHSIFKIGRLFSLFLFHFSCPSCALLCLLILLLFLMTQPWPRLSQLCVRWKCDLVGQVSSMLRLLQMGPSKVLTTFLIPINY